MPSDSSAGGPGRHERPGRREQRRARRELERLMAELDALDRAQGLGALPNGQRPPRRSRPRGGALPGLVITALVLAGLFAWTPSDEMARVRSLLGWDGERLGRVPDVPTGVGSYAFTLTQPGSDEPVGYDPCRPIQLTINPEGAPSQWEELVDTAVEHTEDATGLRFDVLGTTDDRDFARRSGLGSRRPVLVAWATAEELPDLADEVAGVGGSAALEVTPGHLEYVTGMVVLDRDVFTDTDDPGALADQQAIVDHEFAHVVGLAHVRDPRELMNSDNNGLTGYGPGDREGLARLGGIDC